MSGDESVRIDWDLTRPPTVDTVDWPRPELESTEISPVRSVRIRMLDRVLEAGEGEVTDVTIDRVGRRVENIQIDYRPREAEAARDLAVELAEQFGLPRKPFDDWLRSGGHRPDGNRSPLTNSPVDDGNWPAVSVQLRYAFPDAERRTLVSVDVFWPHEVGTSQSEPDATQR